jgi:hypothetical protein
MSFCEVPTLRYQTFLRPVAYGAQYLAAIGGVLCVAASDCVNIACKHRANAPGGDLSGIYLCNDVSPIPFNLWQFKFNVCVSRITILSALMLRIWVHTLTISMAATMR